MFAKWKQKKVTTWHFFQYFYTSLLTIFFFCFMFSWSRSHWMALKKWRFFRWLELSILNGFFWKCLRFDKIFCVWTMLHFHSLMNCGEFLEVFGVSGCMNLFLKFWDIKVSFHKTKFSRQIWPIHLVGNLLTIFFLLILDAIASSENIRIVPSLRSQKGAAWTKTKTEFDWWEIDVVFRVSGRGRIGADGLVSGFEGILLTKVENSFDCFYIF